MLGNTPSAEKIYIAVGHTDMRKAIDGLAALVEQNFKLSPYQKSLFILCSRRRDRIKALYWEEDRFLLLYKCLEGGSFQWSKDAAEVKLITRQELR